LLRPARAGLFFLYQLYARACAAYTGAMPASLEEIVATARRRLEERRNRSVLAELEKRAAAHVPRGFAAGLRAAAVRGTAVIAELKRASPSRGVIRGSFHAASLARELEAGGAAAISVLTDEDFFQGSLTYLDEAEAATRIPLLRKDFIVDEFQVLEARAHGADAVLLIVAALTDIELKTLAGAVRACGLDALCEVHDEPELARALDHGFQIIGVNSRDLRTFQVDRERPFQLAMKLPRHVLKIAESGLTSGKEMAELRAAGYDGVLVGEALMRADHPGDELARMLAEARRERVWTV
jgi:indole-3-glycerol phosphate synthase